MKTALRWLGLGIACGLGMVLPAQAQQNEAPQQGIARNPAPAGVSQPITPLDVRTAAELARTTLIKLVHGHKSGNYSALYELLSPEIQSRVPEERMVQALLKFSPAYQNMSVNGSGILSVEPRLNARPYMDASNMMRLSGWFPTQPFAIAFNLGFRPFDERWRLESFIVEPVMPAQALSAAPAATESVQTPETAAKDANRPAR